MRKPSIFSNDYEKIMKRRRYVFICIGILIVVGIVSFMFKGLGAASEKTGIKDKLQAWVDEDDNTDNSQVASEEPKIVEKEDIDTKTNKEIIDIAVGKSEVKMELEEIDGKKVFGNIVENKDDFFIDISPKKDKILITDEKQNLIIYDIDKKETNITKKEYILSQGDVFQKDSILNTYKDYKWHWQGKFLSDDKVVYISNMPYFGLEDNEYLWIYNLETEEHIQVWSLEGKSIELKNIAKNRLEFVIDGKIMYIDSNGNLVQ